MKIRKLSALLALCLVWTCGGAATAQSLEERWARVENSLFPGTRVEGRPQTAETLTARMAQAKVPGVSIALIIDGRVALVRTIGVADAATGRALTADSVFQAASISKPVAAMGALDLVEDGVLSLDAPINDSLGAWRIPDNGLTAATPVTLRMLLNHTAGVTVSGFPGYAADVVPTVPQILSGVAPANTGAVTVDQAPGTAWRYSGGGLTVVQLAMAEASRQDFTELMQARVLTPVGMRHSTFAQPLPEAWVDHAAWAHSAQGTVYPGRYHTYPEQAAAGLWTTPTDLAQFALALSAAYRGESGGVLSPEMARQMVTQGMGGWGLGVQVRGQGDNVEFRHSGSNPGYRTSLLAFPLRREGLVVMTNGDRGMEMVTPLIRAAAAEFGWPGYGQRVLRVTAVEPQALDSLTGTYANSDTRIEVAVSDAGGTLMMTIPQRRSELIPQGNDLFADTAMAWRVNFERAADGAGAVLIIDAERFERVPTP